MLSFQSSPSHLPVPNSYAEVFTKKWIAKIPNECGYQRGLSNKDNIRQQSWQVFTGAVLHWVQSRCSVINLVSAVTLGPNGVNSHLACRTAEPFSGSWVLATCSSVLQPFRSFPNLFWLIHQLFYNARVPPAVYLLTWCSDFCDGRCLLPLQGVSPTAVTWLHYQRLRQHFVLRTPV